MNAESALLALPSEGHWTEDYHVLPLRVYYEDTDAEGIVYHANYLKFAERGRSEMLRCWGMSTDSIAAQHSLVFAVRRCAVDYRQPGRLGDALWVRTRLPAVEGATLVMEQEIGRREDTILVHVTVHLVMLNGNGRPVRLPTMLLDKIKTRP